MKKYLLLFIFLLGIDVATKYWVHQNLLSMDTISIFNNFLGGINLSINKVYNSGAAWGILADYPIPLLCFRLALVVAIILYAIKASSKIKFFLTILLAGAFGNIIDVLVYGYVVDFIHFTFWKFSWPVFNLADCFITISVIMILLCPRGKNVSV